MYYISWIVFCTWNTLRITESKFSSLRRNINFQQSIFFFEKGVNLLSCATHTRNTLWILGEIQWVLLCWHWKMNRILFYVTLSLLREQAQNWWGLENSQYSNERKLIFGTISWLFERFFSRQAILSENSYRSLIFFLLLVFITLVINCSFWEYK